MKNSVKQLLLILFISLPLNVLFAQIPNGYYENAKGKNGTKLKSALNDIISENHQKLSYEEAYDLLEELDSDPENPGNVLCIYSRFSIDVYDRPKGWNREHIWPKSYGDFGTKRGAGTDLHHLRASDVSTNSARNNRNYDFSAKSSQRNPLFSEQIDPLLYGRYFLVG